MQHDGDVWMSGIQFCQFWDGGLNPKWKGHVDQPVLKGPWQLVPSWMAIGLPPCSPFVGGRNCPVSTWNIPSLIYTESYWFTIHWRCFVGHHFSSPFRSCFQGNAHSIKRSFSTHEAQKVDGAYADVTRKHLLFRISHGPHGFSRGTWAFVKSKWYVDLDGLGDSVMEWVVIPTIDVFFFLEC